MTQVTDDMWWVDGPKQKPSLKKTFWWMAGFGFFAFYAFCLALGTPEQLWAGLVTSALFGLGFFLTLRRHMEIVEERGKWRDQRFFEWLNRPLPELEEPDWDRIERQMNVELGLRTRHRSRPLTEAEKKLAASRKQQFSHHANAYETSVHT